MACEDLLNPTTCVPDGVSDAVGGAVGDVVGGVVGGAALSAWESVCKSFAEAATTLLGGFAKAFVAFPTINPASDGIRGVYGISLGIAAVVAAGLFLLQIARTAFTHDGSGLAYGIVGLGKAALAFMVTLSVTAAGLTASNELTAFIVRRTFSDTGGLEKKLAAILAFQTPQNQASLLLVLAIVGIVLTLVLWFELLLSNAAVAVLIGTSPIAAAGQVSEASRAWWPKLAAATAQLIVLKPVIALVFAVGFGITGDADPAEVGTLLSGMLILLLAALAWPAIARFFTFAQVHVGGGTGLAAVLGFAAGRMNSTSGGSGVPVGVDPDSFGQAAESRTMSSMAARGSSGGGTASGAAGGAAGGAGGAASAAAGVAALATVGVDLAQRAANSLTGRMEQTAGHAGLGGHNPHPHTAGYASYRTPSWPRSGDGDLYIDSRVSGESEGVATGGVPAAPGNPEEGSRTGRASGAGLPDRSPMATGQDSMPTARSATPGGLGWPDPATGTGSPPPTSASSSEPPRETGGPELYGAAGAPPAAPSPGVVGSWSPETGERRGMTRADGDAVGRDGTGGAGDEGHEGRE